MGGSPEVLDEGATRQNDSEGALLFGIFRGELSDVVRQGHSEVLLGEHLHVGVALLPLQRRRY